MMTENTMKRQNACNCCDVPRKDRTCNVRANWFMCHTCPHWNNEKFKIGREDRFKVEE